MPRAGRLVIADCPHHIVQRGHNRRPVLVTDSDRLAYLATLREISQALDLRIHAYCLMTTMFT